MAGVRVLILSAERDAEETSNAEELAEQLRTRVDVDAVEVSGTLTSRPLRLGRVTPAWLRRRLGRPGLAPAFNAFAPHVLVCWDAALTRRLAGLRAGGRLPVPLLTAVADVHALSHAVVPGVDRYLLAWPASAPEAEAIAGDGRVSVVLPPVDPHLLDRPAHGASRGWVARQLKLSLKGGRPLIVVGGGAGGRGDLAGAVSTALGAVPEAAVVAIAGDDAALEAGLRERFADAERVRVLSGGDHLATLLAAADALVDTAAGAGALAAALVGCPMIRAGETSTGERSGGQRSGGEGSTGEDLAAELLSTLAGERPEPLDVSGSTSAADVVVAVALGH